MTPLQINMVLHFHHIAEPWPRAEAPACKDAIEDFVKAGIIEPDDGPSGYRTTERGNALVDHLCAVRFPVARWEQPASDKS